MTYFSNCRTLEEVKKEFHRLAKELHPDNGGNAEEFKKMQSDYTSAFNRCKNIHMDSTGKTYEKETTETPEEYAELINWLISHPGVIVEVCGSWIWLTGDTKPIKDDLKTKGFKWSKNKVAWYWHEEGYHKFHKGTCSMSQIREMYGSTEYRSKTSTAIESN